MVIDGHTDYHNCCNCHCRIRFGLELVLKCLMHSFYFLVVGICCHCLHWALVYSKVASHMLHLEILTLTGAATVQAGFPAGLLYSQNTQQI